MNPMNHPETDAQSVVTRVSAAKSEREILSVLAEGLTTVLDVSGTIAMLPDAQEKVMRGCLGYPGEHWPNIEKVAIDLEEQVGVCIAFKTGEPVVVEDAAADVPTKKWVARLYKCRSVLCVPIIAEKPIGCMIVSESRRRRHFTDDEVKAALDLTTIAGRAIARLKVDPEAQAS